ncbi:ketohexokinase-like isoform X2 [Macrosteles quadrilineatus]|uniref:ketohexokinase-like isoform X2 n=1 Tax=Macrosteles quadrilineatus TaxID=74068 RepID=UPI0023E0A187|nr:ketohexokinase-like isoform X2 [Macrosteles quadrilineatus]
MLKANKRVLCVGVVCVDSIQVCKDFPLEDSDESIDHRWQRGGNASNNCTVLARCGQACEFIGTMSDDLMAKFAKQDFEKENIIIENVVKHNIYETPFSSVIINSKNGSRTIIHSNKGMPELTLEDFKKIDTNQYHWIHFQGRNVSEVSKMLAHLKQRNTKYPGVTTSVELEKAREELKLLLPLADVVFIGKDFAKFQGCKDGFDALQRNIGLVKMGATVVVAWGESGAVAGTTDGTVVESAAFLSSSVVDTLGAGDTFVAATILCLSQGRGLKESITTGCRVAGAKVTKAGFSAVNPSLISDHMT